MKKLTWLFLAVIGSGLAFAQEKPLVKTVVGLSTNIAAKPPAVVIETSMGTIFHRVIDGFMIQGGGFTTDMVQKVTKAPLKSEANGAVPNTRGTLAMARMAAIDSATSQFFINLANNPSLNAGDTTVSERRDYTDEYGRPYWKLVPVPQSGYCVFGTVTEGMDVVDKIAKVQTGQRGPHANVPTTPVVIQSIRRAQ